MKFLSLKPMEEKQILPYTQRKYESLMSCVSVPSHITRRSASFRIKGLSKNLKALDFFLITVLSKTKKWSP